MTCELAFDYLKIAIDYDHKVNSSHCAQQLYEARKAFIESVRHPESDFLKHRLRKIALDLVMIQLKDLK